MNTSIPCSYNFVNFSLSSRSRPRTAATKKKASRYTLNYRGFDRLKQRVESPKMRNHISWKLKLISSRSRPVELARKAIDVFIPAPYAFWWLPISSIFSCPFPFSCALSSIHWSGDSGWCPETPPHSPKAQHSSAVRQLKPSKQDFMGIFLADRLFTLQELS